MQEEVEDFWDTWYSSNIMKLVIESQLPLEKQETLVKFLFNVVENKHVKFPDLSLPELPFDHTNLGKLTRYQTIEEKDKLKVYWILPDCQKEYLTKPLSYFSHLLSHEGECSYISYLRKEGLATEIFAGCDHELHLMSDFYVDILLTQKGMQEYEIVLSGLFKYLHTIDEAGPNEKVFDEVKQLG
jgi:insulysin